MTPLPKRRWSTRRQGKRRAAQTATTLAMQACSNCGKLKISHVVCPACGFYKGKPVISVRETQVENQK